MSIDYSKVYDVDVFSIRDKWVRQSNTFFGSFAVGDIEKLKFQCPSLKCNCWIELSWPWECHYCKHENKPTSLGDSFFGRCQKCNVVPSAYQCPRKGCGFVFQLYPGAKYHSVYATHADYALNPVYPIFPQPEPVQPVLEPVKAPEQPFLPDGLLPRRFEHTLIVADTGWGKTWLMKTIAYHYIERRDAVIVVDSEGGFVRDLLQLRGKSKDDVIYIDFTDPEYTPCLSLFDVKLPDDPREKLRVRGEVIKLFLYVFEGIMGMTLTGKQESMLKILSELMMEIKGASLQTLKSVVFDSRPFERDIVKLRQGARDYFQKDWPTREIGEVKRQLMDRINTIFADPTLERVFTQSKSKIDLFDAINSGKIILVNVHRSYLQDATPILGRLFMATLFNAALRRKEEEIEKYRPAFLFIDEAWRYFDKNLEEMLNTVRKRRLGLVIATQQISQFKEKSTALRNAAFSSAIKFAGVVGDAENAEMMKELGLDPKTSSRDTLQQERAGHHIYASDFYVHVKGQRAQKVRISYDAIQKAAKLDEKELEELIEYNNRRYCEHARLREAKDEPVTEDETVLEPDERGVLRPKGLPKVDGGDEFWQ